MKNQIITKNESGRSMVEMLGVLAVIGVLSIGGIAGYQTAMDRHAFNEWINNWNIFSTLLIGEYSGKDIPDGAEFEAVGFSISNRAEYGIDSFTSFSTPEIKNADVCKKIFEQVDIFDIENVKISYGCWLDQMSGYTVTREEIKEQCSASAVTYPTRLFCSY